MKATESHICKFLDGTDKKFVIPVYQRPYSWKKTNCELLFNDLMTVYEKGYSSHFFGSVVYVEHDIGYNEYTIIDGQQRITTVSILLLAIRNYVLDNSLEIGINPNKITKAYLTDEYAEDEKKLKLKLVQGDDTAYDALIYNNEVITNNSITINYEFFYQKISNLSDVELKGLYDAIMKLIIVKISLNPAAGDDPQLIFESLNSTGLDLDEADKIRNFVLMNLNSREQKKVYKTYWEPLENKVSNYNANKFIRFYLATKMGELSNEKKLYFTFKHYKQANDIDVEPLLADMLIYADYYKTIKTAKIEQGGYKGVLARINSLETHSCTPLLFYLFNAYNKNLLTDLEYISALEIIENYIVRRVVCGLPTNQLNKVFVALSSEIQRYVDKDAVSLFDAFQYAVLNKTGKARFPNDSDFEEKFKLFELYNSKAVRKYFFERLENYGTKERVDVENQIDDGTLTIEHIMPQTLTKEWRDELGENWELIHTKYKDTIGNLTLTAYNSDYSNLPFLKKKNMHNKGFIYSKLSLNAFAATTDNWNETTIIARSNELFKKAKAIWWMPSTSYRPKGEEQWVSWDDDFDYTNMVISKIKVFGTEINTKNVTDAFLKICTTLYELDAINFLKFNNSYFSVEPTDLRFPYEFAKKRYVEKNLSSTAKINLISKLAEHFELEPQDIQFLVKNKKDEMPFDIHDEATYYSCPVGVLAFEFFKFLIKNDFIEEEEIEELKTIEYTQMLFKNTYYPVLANDIDDNKKNSNARRYRKQAIKFDSKNLYVSTQWFEQNREELIAYFNKKTK